MRETTEPDVIDDRWRQSFHLTPPQGLINDPNGLIYWNGAYHVFYQWNPDDCSHRNKHWAHVRSTDLIDWEWLPVALAPDRAYDAQGCYSGSAIDAGDAIVLMYTGNVRDGQGGRASYQCLARSNDGVRFEKLGPVIDGAPAGYTGHFRDPKVWGRPGEWFAVIGAQRNDSKGTVVLAKSVDLYAWDIVGELVLPTESCYMIECPDLFELDGGTVLICCRQSKVECEGAVRREDSAGYLVGDLNLAAPSFSYGEFHPLDRGFEFYAPQTLRTPDGRRLMIGWMGLPLQPETPTVASGWAHCLTIPRELSLERGRLRQRPLRELTRLRGPLVRMQSISLDAGMTVALPRPPGASWELDLSIASSADAHWVLQIFDSEAQSLYLVRDGQRGTIALVRHCPAAGQFGERAECEIATRTVRLQLFVDSSSAEIFLNDGEEVFTTRCYPASEPMSPRLTAAHPLTLHDVHMWPLQKRDV